MSTLQQNIDAINHDINMAFNNLFEYPNEALQNIIESIKPQKEKIIMEPNNEQSDYTITVNDRKIDLYEIITQELQDNDQLSARDNVFVIRADDTDNFIKDIATAISEEMEDRPILPELPYIDNEEPIIVKYFIAKNGNLVKYYQTEKSDPCPWGIYKGKGKFYYMNADAMREHTELFPLTPFKGEGSDE